MTLPYAEMLGAIHASLFYQMAAILLVVSLLGFAGARLRQPLIVTFIGAGLLVGPDLLGIVPAHSAPLETLAELGVALLLFMVGLKLDVTLIRTLGGVSLATAIGQMAFTATIGFLICTGFGFEMIPSLYVATALTFSSTIIIVKLLSDKREVDSLHGRIALGFLIVEDIFVIFYMIFLSTFAGSEQNGPLLGELGLVALKMGALLCLVGLFIARIATPLMNVIARAPELMVTFAVGLATAMAALADLLGFSIELGGLLAGVALASTPLRDMLAARLSSLRDFMLLFFFIVLGSKMDLGTLGDQIVPAAVLSFFVLLGKPLAIIAIMGFMGYRKRTGFMAGLTVAQISEFSLILVTLGVSLGHVDEEMLALVTLVGLITISLSTYMITYSQALYKLAGPLIRRFERKQPHRERKESTLQEGRAYDVILFGLGRYGTEIAKELLKRGLSVLGVDFDPDAVRQARKKQDGASFDAAYGDVADPTFAAHLPLDKARWVVCAVPQHRGTLQDEDFRLTLLETLKVNNFRGRLALVSHSVHETETLRGRGADVVLTPFLDAARQAVDEILDHAPAETAGKA